MKRYKFKGMPASHGASKSHRSIGSTGQRDDAGRVCMASFDCRNQYILSLYFLLFPFLFFLVYVCWWVITNTTEEEHSPQNLSMNSSGKFICQT